MNARERVMRGVVATSGGCWTWIDCTQRGYGRVRWQGRVLRAHRLAYEAFVGSIPVGLQIDHLCRNRACVNPDHLEPVTQQENILRERVARRLQVAGITS